MRQQALTPTAIFMLGRSRTERTIANEDDARAAVKHRSWRNSFDIFRELDLFLENYLEVPVGNRLYLYRDIRRAYRFPKDFFPRTQFCK